MGDRKESLSDRIACVSLPLPRVSRLAMAFYCLTGGSVDTSFRIIAPPVLTNCGDQHPLVMCSGKIGSSLLKRSRVPEQEIVDAITITPTENCGFFRAPIPAPLVYRSSSGHRSNSDCRGCSTFALAYATTQVPGTAGFCS